MNAGLQRVRELSESALRFLFGFRQPVSRLPYATTGFSLAAVKFAGDSLILRHFGHRALTPAEALNPLISERFEGVVAPAETWLALGLWTLPFVWIGVALTYRRLRDAGGHGAMALLFFVPLVNYALIGLLCVFPSASRPESSGVPRPEGNGKAPGEISWQPRFFLSAAAGALVGLSIFWVAVMLRESYGLMLFVGGPLSAGFVAAAVYGPKPAEGRPGPVAAGQLGVLAVGGALLLFALEGAICLVMAYPLAAVLAFLGSHLGALRPVSIRWGPAHLLVFVVVLPFLAAMEPPREAPLREVVTAVEIDAPPEVVWRNVVTFSELPPPTEWTFRAGIAYPVRARIEGEGVGAVRYCEFSTGAFVEPITTWDSPRRLAFGVVAQPPTMEEWSPYRHVEPAHLTGALHTERGEFRLVALPGGRTRLEGSTWYRLEIFPQPYWTLWSDLVIHRIHKRVLNHIRDLAETGGSV